MPFDDDFDEFDELVERKSKKNGMISDFDFISDFPTSDQPLMPTDDFDFSGERKTKTKKSKSRGFEFEAKF